MVIHLGKRFREFKKLLDETYLFLKKREFDKALELYYEVDKKYKQLPEHEKTDYIKNSINRLNQELILYFRIQEAHALLDTKNLEQLKEILDSTAELIENVKTVYPEARNLIIYAENHYKLCLGLYNKKYYEKQFIEKYQEILDLIKEDVNAAFKEYYNLLTIYKKLSSYGYNHEINLILKHLLEEIRIAELVEIAHEPVATYQNIKISKERIHVPIEKREFHGTETREFSEEYEIIKDLIKGNQYNRALELYQKI